MTLGTPRQVTPCHASICETIRQTKNEPQFNARLIGTLVCCAIGLWIALSGHANFTLGGNRLSGRGSIFVDATGFDAVVIGCVAIAFGIINLSIGFRDRRRIPVFWTGAVLLMSTALYGIVRVFV